MTLDELLTQYCGFALSTQYCTPPDFAENRICFQNFYNQVFPSQKTPVHLHLLFFNEAGKQVATIKKRVETGDSIQVDASTVGHVEPGLVAVVALPDFDLVRYSGDSVKLKKIIGTGFYMVWHDRQGHVDTMHEWMPVGRTCLPDRTCYLVFDRAMGAIVRHGLVCVNPIAHVDGVQQPVITIYTANRTTLGQVILDPIPPMGSRMVYMNDIFQEFDVWLMQNERIGVKISGRNLVEPMTIELHRGGDFHIHHIN